MKCSNCNTETDLTRNIFHCECCGKEICMSCHKLIYTYPNQIAWIDGNDIVYQTGGCAFESSGASELEAPHQVCKECYNKLEDQTLYLKKCKEIVEKYSNEMDAVLQSYLKGELHE